VKFLLLTCCFLGLATLVNAASNAASADTVVLLHGLGRTGWSMSQIAAALEREGYRVVNLTYPSRTVPLESLAAEWLPNQLKARGVALAERNVEGNDAPARVHFVTHSMGGILLRVWLRSGALPQNLGRVVMLAPPNAGSQVTDRLNTFPPYGWFTGVNGRRLGTRDTDLPRALGPWPGATDHAARVGTLGIIAASRSLNPLFSAWLPGPDDGKVTVESTRLAGMSDHLVLPFTHTWMAWRVETARQIGIFLRDGRFQHAD
jgi:triacylglycerol lipase